MMRNSFFAAHLFLWSLLLILSYSCATTEAVVPRKAETPSVDSAQVDRLSTDLALLLGYGDEETLRLSRTALTTTDELARTYHVQPPPLWHNFLVNVGIRDRGLCCHWTQDLLRAIEALNLEKFHAVWAVSRHGSWLEHNSVIITVAGQDVETGIVLDPWRNAGDLYWGPVATDTYTWQHHPGDNGVARIRCR